MPYLDPEEMVIAKSHLEFPVVGIGASAGGITALQRLLTDIPEDIGMAFVVVMHLSPEHESVLGSILQRTSRLSVSTVTEDTPIEVNRVYVISPALKLVMSDGHLRVSPLKTLEARRSSIDLFFRSLAHAHEERSICIVLSGTGSDGAQGLRRVKELGGVALVQSPDDAEFDGMPRAALNTEVIDFVMPVKEMASKIAALWANARRIELPAPPLGLEVVRSSNEAALLAEEALISIKALLRERTGHDFAHYKRGTVLRRLERRMQVTAVADLPTYRRLLDAEPRETPALLQDMLISVTNFFRDPEAFSALESAVRSMVGERPPGETFRAWSAGCATGEEAYSLAIILREILGNGASIQVFASDIDERAVAFARSSVYPMSIAADVNEERIRRFFVVEGEMLRINKATRDMVVFSAHNVLSDPPFTRMDLVSCRNLLIYLDRFAQTQVLRTFHFALKPGGHLFLGTSETTEAGDGLFDSTDKAHRLYRATAKAPRARTLPPMPTRVLEISLPSLRAPQPETSKPPLEALHERVVREVAPPTVLVDADDTVLHVSERASHLLRLPQGAPTTKLLGLARPELRVELRAALSRAAETRRAVEAPRVRLSVNGEEHVVVMTVRPANDDTHRGLMLVCFDEVPESLAERDTTSPGRDPIIDSLEAELVKTQGRLKALVGDSTTSTEELRAANEELQTINEELRSTTEELETSKEELQAVNEELTTVNTELTFRMEDTAKLNDDLQNLMNSAEIGTIFVDRDVRLKRFTPQAATLFNLLPSDAGRPLLDITHRLTYPELATDVDDVLRKLKRIEREVESQDGRWLLARAVPYRSSEDRIEGAVLAFFDITSRRKAEEQLRLSEQRMRLVAESMSDYAIITTDEAGVIATWSPGAEKIFGFTTAEAVGQPLGLIFTPEDRAAGLDSEELRLARETGQADDNRWHIRKNGERIFCTGVTTALHDGQVVGYAKIARNSTAQQQVDKERDARLSAERATTYRLKEVGAMKDEFLAVVSHELKNPLSVIQMNAQLLSRLPSQQNDQRAQRATSAIRGAVSSQLQIINDLLELSRANMGKVVLSPAMVDLADLMKNIIEAVSSDAETKRQHLNVELADAAIYADPVRIEQIVWNLVTNAIKFTPAGGSIGVRLTVDSGMAVIRVEDNGIGLDTEHLASVFEMFRQVDGGSNRRTGGLGIGLSLVKQLAELHGGRVSAESAGRGHGACFTVRLPLALNQQNYVAGPGNTTPKLSGLQILVVDDEVELLAAFAAVLEGEGAHVRMAGTAPRAVSLLEEEAADVVISDISMPEHDGYWLAHTIRDEMPARNPVLIAVSGMAREVDRSRAIAAGFDVHIGKPVDMELLESAVIAALKQRVRSS